MKDITPALKKLQALRPNVTQFLLIAAISPATRLKMLKALHLLPKGDEIDVIFNSSGGSPAEAYRMIRALRGKYTTVNVIIPFWAKSAATLLSLGASRIVMHEYGEFGPLDMQIRKDDDVNPIGTFSSALNVQSSLQKIEQRSQERVLEMLIKYRLGNGEMAKIGRTKLVEMLLDHSAKFYAPLLEKLDTMEIGIMERYLNISWMYAMRILRLYTSTHDDDIQRILNYLVYECPDHGHVVDDTLLKSHLPNVVRADEAPFGTAYYTELEKLSILLMEDPDWDEFVGPVDSFLPHPPSSKVTNAKTSAKKTKKAKK